MSGPVLTVDSCTNIHDLIKLFIDHKISSVPVVDEYNRLVGIVTKTDVLGFFMDLDLEKSVKSALHDILDHNPMMEITDSLSEKETTVEEIMTADPVTAEAGTTIDVLARTMVERNIHRIIIVNGGAVTGIVSTLDILYYVAGIEKNG